MREHDARGVQDSLRCLLAMWRVGGSVGRSIYAVVGPEHGHEHARDDDAVLIGVMDTAQLAQAAVTAHNEWLARIERDHT